MVGDAGAPRCRRRSVRWVGFLRGGRAIAAGRGEAGIELLRESVDIAQRVGAIYDVALGLDALADATRDAGYRTRAAELFKRLDVVSPPSTGLS